MNSKTIAIAAGLYFAIFLLAHRTPPEPAKQMFSGVHDLSTATHGKARGSSTYVSAPEGETVSQITPDRFVVPLVVLDGFAPRHVVDLNDVAEWEQRHGTVPAGSLVAVQSDAVVSDGTVEFLARARRIYGLSADPARNVDALKNARHAGLYTVGNLDEVVTIPNAGSIVVISPNVGENGASAPARIYSLLR
ncbi:MAG: cyclase family protein [Acidobacteriales bacterium]|nr:cyclase family protein [Terriglobales bacterium]